MGKNKTQYYAYTQGRQKQTHRNWVVKFSNGPRKNIVQSKQVIRGNNHQAEVPHSCAPGQPLKHHPSYLHHNESPIQPLPGLGY